MFKKYTEISVPSLGVNDSNATIVEWTIDDKKRISKGEVIAVLETTKSAFDIEATVDGYLVQLFKEGDEISAGQVVSLVVEDRELVDQVKKEYIKTKKDKHGKGLNKITKKAELKAKEYGILLADLFAEFDGIIREKDVDTFLTQKDKKEDIIKELNYVGVMNPKFIDELSKDKKFKLLSSSEKISIYRENGAVIEDGVNIGLGSVIIANHIHIMKNAIIGTECYIKSYNFSLGVMSSIGNRSNIVTRNVKIGDVCTFGHNVMVTGGFGINSTIFVGNNSLVSSHCLLDAGEGVYIGEEVGISPHVKLYTHNHWQSELEGYHSNFGPITIQNKAYITGDSLVVPNVTIGEGATVLANSTVINDVEPRDQVCGNPARVIGHIAGGMDFNKKDRIMHRISKDMARYFSQGGKVDPDDVVYISEFVDNSKNNGKYVLAFSVPDNLSEDDIKYTLFDLDRLVIYGRQNAESDEVRNFLRRRGIKFKPIYWRYTGEKHLYSD